MAGEKNTIRETESDDKDGSFRGDRSTLRTSPLGAIDAGTSKLYEPQSTSDHSRFLAPSAPRLSDVAMPMTDVQLVDALQRRDMIRDRVLGEYRTGLDVPFEELAETNVREHGSFLWYDMCCGNFPMGLDLMGNLANRSPYTRTEVLPHSQAVGVDVDTLFANDWKIGSNVTIKRGNAVSYPLPPGVDLLTSYRGLRYIEGYLGMGLQAIENWYNALRIGATLSVDISGHPRLESANVVGFLNNTFGEGSVKRTFDRTSYSGATVFKVVKPDNARLIIPK